MQPVISRFCAAYTTGLVQHCSLIWCTKLVTPKNIPHVMSELG